LPAGGGDCPACGRPVTPPPGYEPVVAPASTLPPPPDPPPGFVPPRPLGEVVPAPAAGPDGWAGWLPAAALTAALVVSFLPWVGSFPGGVRVYTQTPWQAAVGTFTTAILPDGLTGDEAELRQAVRTNWWLLPYLPLLPLAVLAAWAAVAVPDPPARLARVWPHRHRLVAAVAVVLAGLVLVQNWQGFGLETANRRRATAKFADAAAAAGDNTNEQVKVLVRTGYEANRLGVQGTTALDAGVLAHLLAAAAATLGAAGRPLPRLALAY
jgi:hypothetical protein